jgi:hypothetical protein
VDWPEKGEHFKKVSYKIAFLYGIFSKRIERKLLTEFFSQKLGMENRETCEEFYGSGNEYGVGVFD